MAPRPRPSSRSSSPGSRRSGRRRLSTESGAAGGGAPLPTRDRPTISERAALRDEMEASGRDRYDALLRHLQAGRELTVQPRRRSWMPDVHPSARTVLIGALIIAVVWLGAITVTDLLRFGRVDTWDGPDESVQSGLRLAGCPAVSFDEDVYFPAWIRYDGSVFRWTERGRPIGPDSIGSTYQDTGYALGDLVLLLMVKDADGQAGRAILVRQGTSAVGAVYELTDCR